MDFTVYLDESMVQRWKEEEDSRRTLVGQRLLVGAVVVADGAALEGALGRRAKDLLADSTVWNAQPPRSRGKGRRELFAKEHFHFTHDSHAVRAIGLDAMQQQEFRAHVSYSHLSWSTLSAEDIQTAMYFTMARNLLQRYAGAHLTFVFENGSKEMHRRFGKLISHAARTLDRQNRHKARQPRATADARVAPKPNGGLSTVDYCLGVVNLGLGEIHDDGKDRSQPHQRAMVQGLNRHIAHVVNFDEAVHRRRFDMLASPSWAGHIWGANSHSGVEKPFSTVIADGPAGPFAYTDDESTLASALGMTVDTLRAAVARASLPTSYRFTRARIRGKWRRFTVPTDDLLISAQRRIVDLMRPLNDVLHDSCAAYVPGRNAAHAAAPHAGQEWIQTLDVKNFFPATTREIVQATLERLGATTEVGETLTALTTYGNELPTGARTSPPLSNLVLADFDYRMAALAEDRGLRYTRYADDMTFSGASPFTVEPEVSADLARIGYEVNAEKSRIRRRGQPLKVAGLTVDDDHPRVPKRTKKRLRLKLYVLEKALTHSAQTGQSLNDEMTDWANSTRGLYLYCKSIERDVATHLLLNYRRCHRAFTATVSPTQREQAIMSMVGAILDDPTPRLTPASLRVAAQPPVDAQLPESPS